MGSLTMVPGRSGVALRHLHFVYTRSHAADDLLDLGMVFGVTRCLTLALSVGVTNTILIREAKQ